MCNPDDSGYCDPDIDIDIDREAIYRAKEFAKSVVSKPFRLVLVLVPSIPCGNSCLHFLQARLPTISVAASSTRCYCESSE